MRSIHHLPRLPLLLIAVAALVVGATACTPAEIAAYNDMAPADQAKVVAALQDRQDQERRFYEGVAAASADSGNCYVEMREVFPPSTWSWATGIINRESGGNPAAANPSSTARGCFQLLSSLHAGRYAAVGCHVSQWASAHCNVRAAHQLYLAAGTSPWRL